MMKTRLTLLILGLSIIIIVLGMIWVKKNPTYEPILSLLNSILSILSAILSNLETKRLGSSKFTVSISVIIFCVLIYFFVQTYIDQTALIPVLSNTDWTPSERDFSGVTRVLVPVGSFYMGSTNDEIRVGFELCQYSAINNAQCQPNWFEDESSSGDNVQRFIQPFWIDRTEVTRAQYKQCVDANVCEEIATSQYSTADNQPINSITWFQAQAYCGWRGARLPTEAEWEYAARGPSRWIFPWGDDLTLPLANHCDRNCSAATWASPLSYVNETNNDSYTVTSPVGAYPKGASWVGALDMAGNVWEWTSSLALDYPYSTDHENSRDQSSVRILRGGSFDDSINFMRSADRVRLLPTTANHDVGFRCAASF